MDASIKWCSRCKNTVVEKAGYCKECKRDYQREWNKKNPGKANEYLRQWRQENPEKAKAIIVRYRSKVKPPAIRRRKPPTDADRAKWREDYYANRQTILARHRAFYRANREKQILRLNAKKQLRRARQLGVTVENVTAADRIRIAQRQANKCWWCKARLDSFHLDHVIPLSKGGEHSVRNLVASCPDCNLRKSAKMPWEFAGRLF